MVLDQGFVFENLECLVVSRSGFVFTKDAEVDILIGPTGLTDGFVNIGWGLGQRFYPLAKPIVGIKFIKSDTGLENFNQTKTFVTNGVGKNSGRFGNGSGKGTGDKRSSG